MTIISASNTPRREDVMVSSAIPFLASPPPIRRLKSDTSFMTSPSLRRVPESGRRVPETETYRRQQGSLSQREDQVSLNPIVQIKFCGKKYQTRPDRKSNPSWKQVIEIPLPFDKEGEFTPQKLKDIEEPIEVTLFDTVDIDIGKGGGYYDDEVTIVTEKRFLGNLKIPLRSIYNEVKQQGTFILNTPDVMLGYAARHDHFKGTGSMNFATSRQLSFIPATREHDVESQFQGNADDSNSKSLTSLSMLVTLEPLVQMVDEPTLTLPSNENPTMVQHALDWMRRYSNVNPCGNKRQASILANGSNGKRNLITRFLHAQAPPPECQASLSQCAHYVSLIPFLSTWKAFNQDSRQRMWLTSQTVLDITAGDWDAHAALLANYFMYMNDVRVESVDPVEVYLVIGSSITEGKVVSIKIRTLKLNAQPPTRSFTYSRFVPSFRSMS